MFLLAEGTEQANRQEEGAHDQNCKGGQRGQLALDDAQEQDGIQAGEADGEGNRGGFFHLAEGTDQANRQEEGAHRQNCKGGQTQADAEILAGKLSEFQQGADGPFEVSGLDVLGVEEVGPLLGDAGNKVTHFPVQAHLDLFGLGPQGLVILGFLQGFLGRRALFAE